MTKEEFTQAVIDAELGLYRAAKSILLNDEDCADAIQNAICQAYAKIDTLKQDRFFKTWITRILINECYKFLRDKAREQEVPYEEYMLEQRTSESDSEIYQMITELEDKYRVPFVLHYIEGYSIKEIAQILSISSGNVCSLYNMAATHASYDRRKTNQTSERNLLVMASVSGFQKNDN